MENERLQKAVEELVCALHETETYREYASLRESIMADAENRVLIRRFTEAQTALQMAALAGHAPREEDTAQFEKLSALLYSGDEMTDYLLAQMKVQKMVAELLERITRDVGIDIPLS